MQMTKPVVEGPLGSPPFERFSINKGISNFVMYKYNQLVPKVCISITRQFFDPRRISIKV